MSETYTVNLFEFIQPFRHIPKDEAEKTLLHCLKLQAKNDDIKYDGDEIRTIAKMVDIVQKHCSDISILDNFFYEYEYTPINEEFDLLRIDDTCILNVEIKSQLPEDGLPGIEDQLRRHNFYLKRIEDKEVFSIAFRGDTKTFYQYDADKDEIKEISINTFIDILKNTNTNAMLQGLEELFTPERHLISPVDNIEDFINERYFLTKQQKTVKDSLLQDSFGDFLVTGGPGTGKTLMLYDIAKEYLKRDLAVLALYCRSESDSHTALNEKLKEDFNNKNLPIIAPIKRISSLGLSRYDVILVDETQRIWKNNGDRDINTLLDNTGDEQKRIFFIDQRQVLSKTEKENAIEKYLTSEYQFKKKSLKEKASVRINKDLYDAIMQRLVPHLFPEYQPKDTDKNFSHVVQIHYAPTSEVREQLKEKFENENYTYIAFSSAYKKSKNHPLYRTVDEVHVPGCDAHGVIGQEFDKILIILNSYFENGNLETPKEHPHGDYQFDRMLYQMLTRARSSVKIIVEGDERLYANLVEKILGQHVQQ